MRASSGSARYATDDESRNNPLTALFAVGEGWHNNHHRYQRAARNGFYWWEVDLTWYAIRAMQSVGLAWDVQPVPARVHVLGGPPGSSESADDRISRRRGKQENDH